MPSRPQAVPWPRDPHTAAKHAIYRRYLERWWPILIRGYGGDVTYAEGFAGPGVYAGNEPGSPVIALQALLEQSSVKRLVQHARLLLVDADQRCTDLLTQQLQAVRPQFPLAVLRDTYKIDIRVERGPCEPTLEQLLAQTGAWGHPMLVVLDSFGGAVSACLLRRVAGNEAGEVLVTLQPQHFLRFAEADVTNGDDVFGHTGWRDVATQPSSSKARWLLQQYRETVQASGFAFVLDFELIDDRGQLLYLVFGTNHRRGLEKMKEVMWEVDDVTGVRYRDPRDPDQQALEITVQPQTAPLRRQVHLHLARQPGRRARVADLREFALFETVYKPSQVGPVLRALADSGELTSDSVPISNSSTVWLSTPSNPVTAT